ncbi:hypothetical protein F2Q70_00036830 [Brassica cretica]|uniref:Uncharacterized protein n=1 Tax=Brassica cretica TaxID=69181 RepID=A0A8S9GFZ3_BRACR|nr:hypothetical protein F2Q68_00032155 [Brassica cretica]KAF2586459.1 hypothetical protein F2Q70_00036830 [Brassica cretica]
MTETPEVRPQRGLGTTTETDGVLSEPISVLVEAAVAITSVEENEGEDKGSESVVEGDKDGEEDDEVTI